jgi:hypothetical protein
MNVNVNWLILSIVIRPSGSYRFHIINVQDIVRLYCWTGRNHTSMCGIATYYYPRLIPGPGPRGLSTRRIQAIVLGDDNINKTRCICCGYKHVCFCLKLIKMMMIMMMYPVRMWWWQFNNLRDNLLNYQL